MSRTFEEIETDLKLLMPHDFNLKNIGADGIERLHRSVDELVELNEPERMSELLLLTIERLSNTEEIDPRFELGNPGPAVHALERLPNYSQQLKESIKRYPTPLTVWMINRILNAEISEEDRNYWLTALQEILKHPLATRMVIEEAQSFSNFQETRNHKDAPLG